MKDIVSKLLLIYRCHSNMASRLANYIWKVDNSGQETQIRFTFQSDDGTMTAFLLYR